LPDGVSLGTATHQIDGIRAQLGVPADVLTSYGGTAAVFQQSTADEWILVIAAVVTIYVILGALYESFVHPLTILSGLPAATFGGLLTSQLLALFITPVIFVEIDRLGAFARRLALRGFRVGRYRPQPQPAE